MHTLNNFDQRSKSRMKSSLLNYLLTFTSIILTIIFLEFFFNQYLIDKTPLKFHFALPKAMEVLAQSSKDARLPKNYIALAGDSYAQGKGDWLLNANPDKNGPFHSAHLIHQYLGQDVISLGHSGASSTRGLVELPLAKFGFLKRNIATDIQNPKHILVYFYAGNDLADNWKEYNQDFVSLYGKNKVNDDAAWNSYFEQQIKSRKVGIISFIDSNYGWLVHTVRKVISSSFSTSIDQGIDISIDSNNQAINQAMIAGKVQTLPSDLQTPAMTLNEEQTQLALDIFTRSLIYMKKYFKDAQVTVVYIPSVLSSYQVVTAHVNNLYIKNTKNAASDTKVLISASQLTQRSEEIARAIEKITRQQSMVFLDTRPVILQAAQQQYIHGPRDWKHFNRTGYEALSKAIVCSEQFKESLLEKYTYLCQ